MLWKKNGVYKSVSTILSFRSFKKCEKCQKPIWKLINNVSVPVNVAFELWRPSVFSINKFFFKLSVYLFVFSLRDVYNLRLFIFAVCKFKKIYKTPRYFIIHTIIP